MSHPIHPMMASRTQPLIYMTFPKDSSVAGQLYEATNYARMSRWSCLEGQDMTKSLQ